MLLVVIKNRDIWVFVVEVRRLERLFLRFLLHWTRNISLLVVFWKHVFKHCEGEVREEQSSNQHQNREDNYDRGVELQHKLVHKFLPALQTNRLENYQESRVNVVERPAIVMQQSLRADKTFQQTYTFDCSAETRTLKFYLAAQTPNARISCCCLITAAVQPQQK